MRLFQNIGIYILFMKRTFSRPEKFSVLYRQTMREIEKVGINSFSIVVIISLFVGAVITIQTNFNIENPLLPRYLVGVTVRDSLLLEFSSTMVALILAGKVGSSIASELGMMRITEQIDALEVMGINSSSFLVLPKIIACLIMYPLLVILAGFLGIIGGYIAATLTGAMTPDEYIYGIRADFIEYNVTFALIKSIVFAFLISTISSFTGYFTQGGALEVGRASTKAVTTSCIAILSADYLLAQLLL